MTNTGSNIWEITIPLAAGTSHEYKFTLDGWNSQENLTSGSPGTVTNFGFTHRGITVGNSDIVLDAVGFNLSTPLEKIPPTVQITSDKNLLKSGETATITFTFSETVTNFADSDVTTTIGTLGTLSGSEMVYTATFTPSANFEGTATISIASNKFSDAAGNYNVDGSDANNTVLIAVDTAIPTVQITSDKTSLKIGETATLTITFSETVTDFVIGDLSTTNGTITSLSANVNVYTAIFTPSANFEGTATISIADGRFSDAAGNYNVDGSDANNTVSIAVDTIAPGNPSVTGTETGAISGTAEANSTLLATKTNNTTQSVSVDTTGHWRLNVASIDSYVFRARDTAGNVSNPTTFLSSSFSFRYPGSSSPFRFPVGAPIKSIGMSSGGRIPGDTSTSFKIKPALPAGLSFSRRTGKITGTPLEPLAATEYTITSQSTIYLPRKAKITIEIL